MMGQRALGRWVLHCTIGDLRRLSSLHVQHSKGDCFTFFDKRVQVRKPLKDSQVWYNTAIGHGLVELRV